jgi:hypothetical protein
MTDREAIKALKLEGGLEISGKPRRAAEFLEGLSVAESALQEREERSKGCTICYTDGKHNPFVSGYNYCPWCGRALKEE